MNTLISARTGILGGVFGSALGASVGTTIDILVFGKEQLFREPEKVSTLGASVGYFILGALYGGGLAFAIVLARLLGKDGKIWLPIAGIVSGMLLGAVLWPASGSGEPNYTYGNIVLGAFFGAVYCGGISLSVILRTRLRKNVRTLIRLSVGAVFGLLLGSTFKFMFLGLFMGLGTTAGIGIIQDIFQVKPVQRTLP